MLFEKKDLFRIFLTLVLLNHSILFCSIQSRFFVPPSFNGGTQENKPCSCVENVDCCQLDLCDLGDQLEEHEKDMNSSLEILQCDHRKLMSNQADIYQKTCSVIDTADDLDDKSSTINSKIDELNGDFTQTWTILKEINHVLDEADCDQASLFQTDVGENGFIILDTPGNYCFAEDIVGSVSIIAENVCLNLNCRELVGHVFIDNIHATVKSGKITAPSPCNNDDASHAVIEISRNAEKTFIIEVYVTAQDSVGSCRGRSIDGVNGRTAIETKGPDTIILRSIIKAGSASDGMARGECAYSGCGGHGGSGIIGKSTKGLRVEDCFIEAGNGANGADGNAGEFVQNLKNCDEGDCEDPRVNGGVAGSGGNAGHGICTSSDDVHIQKCSIKAGSGGNGGTGGQGVNGGNAGNGGCGGIGVRDVGQQDLLIFDCHIAGGRGGHGGIGGDGLGGNNPTYLCPNNPNGNGGNGGLGGCGGHGIFICAANGNIHDNYVESHSGGKGGNGGLAFGDGINGAGRSGGNGGDGIHICQYADGTIVRACSVDGTGDGGDAGGSGGQTCNCSFDESCIDILACCDDEVDMCRLSVCSCCSSDELIDLTCQCGNAGNGGNGIFISQLVNDTQVCLCTIAYTGHAGVPVLCQSRANRGAGFTGLDGKAINDQSSHSIIFQNFAYNIANACHYTIEGAPGEGGKAVSACHDQHDNLFDDDTNIVGGVNRICSLLDIVTSELEECCLATNSSIDLIDVDLEQCCLTINSKLDILNYDLQDHDITVNSKLDELADSFIETWTVLNGLQVSVSSKLDVIDDTLAECCVTVNSKLEVIDEDLLLCCSAVNSKLDDLGIALEEHNDLVSSKLEVLLRTNVCEPVAIPNDDFPLVAGLIKLDKAGNYCLAMDMTATVTIVASNVCLDLNCRELTGRIVVGSDVGSIKNVTICNGTVHAQMPVDAADSSHATIEVMCDVEKTKLIDLCIIAEDIPFSPCVCLNFQLECIDLADPGLGVPGRAGLFNCGKQTFIINSLIRGGGSGPIIDAGPTPPALPGEDGFDLVGLQGAPGVLNVGERLLIIDSVLQGGRGGQNGGKAGNGGAGSDATILNDSGQNGGNGGNLIGGRGGYGMSSDADYLFIKQSRLVGGIGGTATGKAGDAGNGGNGNGSGDGGVGGDGGSVISGIGGTALISTGTQMCVLHCKIEGGAAGAEVAALPGSGAAGGVGGTSGNPGANGVNGILVSGATGTGVSHRGDCSIIKNSCIFANIGLELLGFASQNRIIECTVKSSGNGGDGIFITDTASNNEVSSCTISCVGGSGLAINDDSTSSFIYSNVAYAIERMDSKFDILGTAYDAPDGTDLCASTDRLDNIYTPCAVP